MNSHTTCRLLITFALGSALASSQAANDLFRAIPLNVPRGHTSCAASITFTPNDRVPVVRGNVRHQIRIERHGVDVGLLDDVDVESCNGNCSARITRKGNFDSGGNGNLIDRKGFVELDFNAAANAPAGNATLVLKYIGGGRGEYKLDIVRNTVVTNVTRSSVAGAKERYTLTGNNLDHLESDFTLGTHDLRLVSKADALLVLDRTSRNCSTQTLEFRLRSNDGRFCSVKDVGIQMARDADCSTPGSSSQSTNQQPPVTGGGGGSSNVARLNFTPLVNTPVPVFRSLNPTLSDNTAARRQVLQSFCANFANDEERTINLSSIGWGIGFSGLPSPAPVVAEISDLQGRVLDRRTADPITAGNGSDARTFNNWPGRPTSVKVVNAFSEAKRRAMGASTIGGNAAPPPAIGCYLAPSEPLSRFDPPQLKVRVNTATPPAPETQTNDNEITF